MNELNSNMVSLVEQESNQIFFNEGGEAENLSLSKLAVVVSQVVE